MDNQINLFGDEPMKDKPKNESIGHSKVTPDKQFRLDKMLRQHMNVVKAILDKYKNMPQKYYYFDLNAGDGTNIENCSGSPLIFLEAVNGSGLDYESHFIDIEHANIHELKKRMPSNDSRVSIHLGDNSEVMDRLIKNISLNHRQYAYGLIYTDPNGRPDFDLLGRISTALPKFDILIRCNVNAIKRNGQKPIEQLAKIHKQQLIIQEPLSSDKWQWAFMLMTNYADYKAWEKHGFYRADTPRGLAIMRRLNYTNKELLESTVASMFGTEKKEAIRRSGGRCERCGNANATEIHHKVYRGRERSEDLLHVCHKCHCDIEGEIN